MAKIDILSPFIESAEGGYVNDPDDPGGATNKGITLKIWKKVGYDKNNDGKIDKYDIKLINHADFQTVLKKEFWDVCKGDLIKDQSVANMLVDWFYNSGYNAIYRTQRILGLKVDGKVGQKTLYSINSYNPKHLFLLLKSMRISYLQHCNNFKKYGRGWLSRVNRIYYGKIKYLTDEKIWKTVNF